MIDFITILNALYLLTVSNNTHYNVSVVAQWLAYVGKTVQLLNIIMVNFTYCSTLHNEWLDKY